MKYALMYEIKSALTFDVSPAYWKFSNFCSVSDTIIKANIVNYHLINAHLKKIRFYHGGFNMKVFGVELSVVVHPFNDDEEDEDISEN